MEFRWTICVLALAFLANTQAWSPVIPNFAMRTKQHCSASEVSRISLGQRSPLKLNMLASADSKVVEVVEPDVLQNLMKAGNGNLIVDFSAESRGCAPCLLLSPHLESVAKEYQDKMRVIKIDSDKWSAFTSEMKVTALPTLFYVKNGETVLRVEGAMMAKKLRAITDYVFFGGPPPRGVDPAVSVWEASKVVV